MKRRRVILIVAGILVTVVVAVLVWPGEREPVYQGKKLSEWLIDPPTSLEAEYYPDAQTQDAVRHIGTNALPTLLKWMRCERSGLGIKVAAAAAKLPRDLANSRLMMSVRADRSFLRRHAAGVGFVIIGSNAAPAIAELAGMAADPKLPGSYDATMAMAAVGERGFPPLLAAVANPAHPNRGLAVRHLAYMKNNGVDVSAAVPVLVKCLQEADEGVAGAAAKTLGEIKLMPEVSVPALTQCVHDSREGVRILAILALGEFGAQGRASVPALLPLLRDPGATTRKGATNALREIAPEVLRTNGVGGR